MSVLRSMVREIPKYPSALIGSLIILLLVGVAIYAVIAIPYSEAVALWRGGEEVWYDHPKNASPVWTGWFQRDKPSQTITVSSQEGAVVKTTEVISEDMTDISFSLAFDYPYDGFPQELTVFFDTEYLEKLPYASIAWLTPDGREIRIGDFSLEGDQVYRVSQDSKLERRLGTEFPQVALFADPATFDEVNLEAAVPVKGRYEMQISTLIFDEEDKIDAELVVYGEVHGLAGTDHRRRDLMVALLWGTPIALAFGLLAAVGTTFTTMFFAALGSWYGGWLDELIQRFTEINLILPLLPILIMVATFYSRSLWLMLGVLILLSIFGGAIKVYRAVFLQEKQSPYIEAARAYGASDSRIIFHYMIPRVVPMLIPQLVVLVPTFVFFEASLAVLGLGDPVLPTWGKVINDAYNNGALFEGFYYWVLLPSILLMLTGFAFAMLGYSLDRIFNPRLRGL
jgi:peptide/nickel transport system permease protein